MILPRLASFKLPNLETEIRTGDVIATAVPMTAPVRPRRPHIQTKKLMIVNRLYIRHDRYEPNRRKARLIAARIDPFPWVLSDISLERAYSSIVASNLSLCGHSSRIFDRPTILQCAWISFQMAGTALLSTVDITSLRFANRNPRIVTRNAVLQSQR
jgi:hypothetical protein